MDAPQPARAPLLGSLAEQAALSQRTLQRQFLDATGLSPIDWLIRERVASRASCWKPLTGRCSGLQNRPALVRRNRSVGTSAVRSTRALPSTAASIAAVSVPTGWWAVDPVRGAIAA